MNYEMTRGTLLDAAPRAVPLIRKLGVGIAPVWRIPDPAPPGRAGTGDDGGCELLSLSLTQTDIGEVTTNAQHVAGHTVTHPGPVVAHHHLPALAVHVGASLLRRSRRALSHWLDRKCVPRPTPILLLLLLR